MDKMALLREALDSLRAECEPSPKIVDAPHKVPKHDDAANTFERCANLAVQDWTRESLRYLEPDDVRSYKIAFEMLVAPRRSYLRTLGNEIVLALGKCAFEQFLRTDSVALSDYLSLGADLESRWHVPPFTPSGEFAIPHIKP